MGQGTKKQRTVDSNLDSASARLQVSEDGMEVGLYGMEDSSGNNGDIVSANDRDTASDDSGPRQTGLTRQQRGLDELWRRVVGKGVFRIRWVSVQPDGDCALRADAEDDAYLGLFQFDVLRREHSSKCWVHAYVCAFAQDLWMSKAGDSGNELEGGGIGGGGSALNVTVLSDLKRGEAVGDRRLLETRLAIVERLLVLQSLSSVLIGAKALLAAL